MKTKKISTSKKLGFPCYELKLRVPFDYNHDTRLNSFRKKIKSFKWTFQHLKEDDLNMDSDITDENFNRVTNKFIPGRIYTIKFIPVLDVGELKYNECLEYLRSQNALLVGPHGLSLLYEYSLKSCPKGKNIISLDTKENLWIDDNGVPSISYLKLAENNSSGINSFRTRMYKYELRFDIEPGEYILCVLLDD